MIPSRRDRFDTLSAMRRIIAGLKRNPWLVAGLCFIALIWAMILAFFVLLFRFPTPNFPVAIVVLLFALMLMVLLLLSIGILAFASIAIRQIAHRLKKRGRPEPLLDSLGQE